MTTSVIPQAFRITSEDVISTVIPRFGAKPVVVTAVVGGFGWNVSWRDSRHRLRWSTVDNRDRAERECWRIATARMQGTQTGAAT